MKEKIKRLYEERESEIKIALCAVANLSILAIVTYAIGSKIGYKKGADDMFQGFCNALASGKQLEIEHSNGETILHIIGNVSNKEK